MIQGSLFRRLIPPLVAAIALLTAVVTWAGTRMMNDALADRARRRAVSLSTVERDGILRLMRAGEHRDLQDVLEQLGRNPDIAVVRILRPDGAVYASSRPLEKGRVIAGHVALGSDSGDLIPGSGGILRRSHGVVHIVRPFENAKECETCHREAGQPMAWLDMDVDVNEHSIGFATFTSLSVALGGLYLLGAMGILVPQLVSVVLRPLKRVTRAMGKVRDGDLTVSVEPGGTREIDTVVTGFNRMVGDLRKAKAVEEEARRLHMERVEQLASVGELAAGLAHEVRNPLSGVKAVVEVLARETNDSSRRRILLDASGELVRIDQILKDLLQFARPKAPALAPFDLNALVEDAVALTFPAGGGNQTVVRRALADVLPSALGDRGQVRQVLVNLLMNAQQASTAKGKVTVSTGSLDGHLWCRVRDEGTGVPADRADAIFKPFVTSRTRGTGLGLSMSRRIVELHGGRLELDNPGEPGASFTFTLPHAPADAH
jgi:hypothetical protein